MRVHRLDRSAGLPGEPAAHHVGMKGRDEDGHTPERDAGARHLLAELAEHILGARS
jgi:hypothetical protein